MNDNQENIFMQILCGCIGIFWQNQQNPNEIMMVGHSASQWALFYTSCSLLHPSNWFYLQSWSKVMVHVAFFDNFTIPPHIQCWVTIVKVSPLKQHCMGRGGRAKFGKKSHFRHWTGGDDENIANFQGVLYTFDQDCRYSGRNTYSNAEPCQNNLGATWKTQNVLEYFRSQGLIMVFL